MRTFVTLIGVLLLASVEPVHATGSTVLHVFKQLDQKSRKEKNDQGDSEQAKRHAEIVGKEEKVLV